MPQSIRCDEVQRPDVLRGCLRHHFVSRPRPYLGMGEAFRPVRGIRFGLVGGGVPRLRGGFDLTGDRELRPGGRRRCRRRGSGPSLPADRPRAMPGLSLPYCWRRLPCLTGGEAAGLSSTGACGCAALFSATSGPSASAGVLTSDIGGLVSVGGADATAGGVWSSGSAGALAACPVTAGGCAVAVAGSAATGSCATGWLSVTAGAAREVLSFDEAGDDATGAASTGAGATAGTE